jgi:biopolymer transport protein ExbD
MPIQKRNKVSADFNMSSLTDIIFLLLIFFMLTSNMVNLEVDLPQSDSKTVAPTDLPVVVKKDGSITVKGLTSNLESLEKDIANAVHEMNNKDNTTLNIVVEVGTPWQEVHNLMNIAAGLKIKAILATQPVKS